MLTCLAAECTATYSLAKYTALQEHIEKYTHGRSSLHQHDILVAEAMTICFCVFVATLFGADFFFLLFWPRRLYPMWYNFTKKALAVAITAGVFASAVLSNVVVARHTAFVVRATPEEAKALTDIFFRPPLKYYKWPTNIAYVVQLWVGFIFTAASTVLLFVAADHDETYGIEPKPATMIAVENPSPESRSRLRA
ncbi:uncharacterized protein EI90DRAFT_2925714 [Cantharellus anzutake]|uniref:uncharacterized protein n=1 Tax=Cantharellus anzutake TaxID=1750568 RepID=UPI0019084512|nr:uncharacterized protein EI90DRAFT_2940803 [Cantharellus anzutake]XP_038914306.1 uncharacterized protein EI90DRAFT_2925714 [Cantharellus anzutake]KAF8319223.1 hypothetical protein EI90DRAFT_2940803 [Cantharellus anzutake]KAF8328542.1 hypothetical protein EI90DRAFT_2925714 [Cantharellus anzutake]